MKVPYPHTLRDAQWQADRLVHFISKSAQKAMPLFQTFKGCIEKSNFQWTPAVEATFQQLKEDLHKLKTLASTVLGETLQVYLSASNEAISFMLAIERQRKQLLVYFVNQALQGPKVNYPILEMLVLSLIYVAQRLR